MKGLKRGPELKMPELKMPDFVTDLFYDLHDRRLLAPIALVVVAIAAVPFLLGGGSESPPAEPGGATAATAEREIAEAASLTVVEAKPGLRDYRKRLASRKPTNPFKQRYTAPDTSGAELSETDSSSSTATTVTTGGSSEATTVSSETTTTPNDSPSTTSPGKPSSSGGGDGKPHLTFYTWGINVWIAKHGGKSADPGDKGESGVKHKVLPQTSLPGEKAPVVTYLGLSRKAAEKSHAKALLLVSDDVTSIEGETHCAARSASEVCQLLEVEPGFPVTLVYGANETRYTIKVLKIELVVTGHS
jgi:hypothetical protein